MLMRALKIGLPLVSIVVAVVAGALVLKGPAVRVVFEEETWLVNRRDYVELYLGREPDKKYYASCFEPGSATEADKIAACKKRIQR